jgi:hypothetical protein
VSEGSPASTSGRRTALDVIGTLRHSLGFGATSQLSAASSAVMALMPSAAPY